ncbi:MAG TPA: alpha/beta hydrolase family protein [Armatimonadota bacterium]|jgi:dienelactone hydrolase
MAVSANLYPLIRQYAPQTLPALSFLQERFSDVASWRDSTRDILDSLLHFAPERVELSPELVDHTDYADYAQQKWYITSSPGDRIPVFLLKPKGVTGRIPAIVALHCHGGMYFFGKKKLLPEENEPYLLTQYRQSVYEGTAIAEELVKRGYLVAVIDSFYFGERRLITPPPSEMQEEFLLAAEGSDHWLDLVNQVAWKMEADIAKSLFLAGVTWPGILAWDDRRTVDFLLTLPEVDPERIGCIGFSTGGFRSALLGALDPRVSAVCVVGWMSMLEDLLEDAVAHHSWAHVLPGLSPLLDWPDVAALHAPNPLIVLQGSQDSLFPVNGYQRAAERLRGVYAKAGAPGNLDIGLFEAPHSFTREMQHQAWAFFANVFGA